ncbi:hypothetical protein LXA43DRAFT_878795 [Ganoderma leucocontextum]|nr:hypothetical protein LXA43DRAFT_878795 [Ganoderma leucocontextum]
MDYGNSPGSEPSVYFDAPTVNSNSRFTEGLPAAAHSDPDLPGAFGDNDDGANIKRKASLGAVYASVAQRAPAGGDEKEEARELEQDSSHRRAPSATLTADSGYASNGNGKERRSPSRASDGDGSLAPIPILWTHSSHRGQPSLVDSEAHDRSSKGSPFRRAASLRSFRVGRGEKDEYRDREERGSVKTAPSITGAAGLRRRRTSLVQGSFASGPGMVGPASTPVLDDAFHARSRSADLGLSERQRVKLSKGQIKEGKKVAKIIKAEGKAEQKAIDEAVRELGDLQKMQKTAVKEEGKAYAAYSKTLREFRKAELEFFAVRAKYERAQADLQAQEDAREASRAHARETTEMLQEKNREVEWLRAQKAVDDREREAKVRELTGK